MDLLESLHQRLLLSIAPPRSTPNRLTIGDLYQRLIPYRTVRDDLNVLELAEYEHALLRMLAGERGYLRVEPASVAVELQRELASSNPILGIYRDYAEASVRMRDSVSAADGREGMPVEGSSHSPEPGHPVGEESGPLAAPGRLGALREVGDDEAAGNDGHAMGAKVASVGDATTGDTRSRKSTPSPGQDAPLQREPEPLPLLFPVRPSGAASEVPARPIFPASADPGPSQVSNAERSSPSRSPSFVAQSRCPACAADLPHGIDARFCPSCGLQQVPHACQQCGARVDPRWSFCAACGTGLPKA